MPLTQTQTVRMNMDVKPRIPIELQNIVIGELFGDHDTLRLCSLVCHAWLPVARRRLFHHVEIHAELEHSIALLSRFSSLVQSNPSTVSVRPKRRVTGHTHQIRRFRERRSRCHGPTRRFRVQFLQPTEYGFRGRLRRRMSVNKLLKV